MLNERVINVASGTNDTSRREHSIVIYVTLIHQDALVYLAIFVNVSIVHDYGVDDIGSFTDVGIFS